MDQEIINIGFIPSDIVSKRITCGDPESYGSKKEIFFEIQYGLFDYIVDQEIPKKKHKIDTFFSYPSKAFDLIVSKISEVFSIRVDPHDLVVAWSIFQDEVSDETLEDTSVILVESEYGEFVNNKGEHNGKIFVRYVVQDPNVDDPSVEIVVLISPR
jgi:hypothetical protein